LQSSVAGWVFPGEEMSSVCSFTFCHALGFSLELPSWLWWSWCLWESVFCSLPFKAELNSLKPPCF
jgi:hypothetical protein